MPPNSRPVGNCFRSACPAREVMTHVSNRWGGLVLASLRERNLRYSEIRSRVDGISEKMLARTLDVLERDGLIARHSFPVMPPHVEYALTPAGRELSRRLMELFDWIGANVSTYVRAQKRYDTRQESA